MCMADPQLTAHEVLRAFHRDEPYLYLGAAFTTVGLVCGGLCLLRRRLDALLLWLGAFAFLYGQRLWMQSTLLSLTLPNNPFFEELRQAIDPLVPVPAFFFFQSAGIMGRKGRTIALLLGGLFLSLSIATLLTGAPPILHLHALNNVLVIVALLWLLLEAFWRGSGDRDFRLMRRGLMCFVLLALWDNTLGMYTVHPIILEPYGFAVFLSCLGVVAARRTMHRDKELREIQRELELARQIQLSLLPAAFPPSPAFRVAARYVPMRAVAGDLYDFLVVEDGHAGLLIADVTGHGVPAALIAGMVKMAAISQRPQAGSPGRLLAAMNTALCGNTQGQFVTAAYAYLDAHQGSLRYAAAGHPPLLVLREGRITEIAENGLLMAAVDEVEYADSSFPLQRGDRVLLYTDGLVEARNSKGVLFGEEALETALAETASLEADAAADAIIRRVQDWAKTQEDDLTILVCDFVGLTPA